ncbi:hypothetical protein BHM03_00012811 [Ensete ventricosum]|nr:hypothetical protein BHM03_00012811 [Ensete ventricosum]
MLLMVQVDPSSSLPCDAALYGPEQCGIGCTSPVGSIALPSGPCYYDVKQLVLLGEDAGAGEEDGRGTIGDKKKKSTREGRRGWSADLAGAGDDNNRGMTTAHGQRSRTCGGVPFLLKMPTTMREGTSMVGKNGIWQPTTTGGEMQAMGAALMVAMTDDVGLRRL